MPPSEASRVPSETTGGSVEAGAGSVAVGPASSLGQIQEAFICACSSDRRPIFPRLVRALRHSIEQSNFDQAAEALRLAAGPNLDYTSARALAGVRQRLRDKARLRHSVRVAVVGSFNTKQLVSLLDLFLFAAGVELDVYEAEYGVFRQEILDADSQLYRFAPQTLFLATTRRDIMHHLEVGAEWGDVSEQVVSEAREWSKLWNIAHARCGCQIIQNNFNLPPWRPFANHENRHPASAGRFMDRLNDALAENAPPFVTIHDVEHLASLAGRWRWDESRFYHQAKLPCHPECLVEYAHSLASVIGAQLGLAKKCLVLDLDNTLWGGVIGDDGLGGIRLGQGDPLGEAFIEFQRYVKSLQLRGVLLAICSKNDPLKAEEVFERHPEMVLRKKDIACFLANWDDKVANLRSVAQQLNIGVDALVFADDDPVERALVRQFLPRVAVPELPEDASGYVKTLEQHRYFQVLGVTAEDFQRTAYYKADQMRTPVQASATDLRSFLQSLEMAARIGPITAATLERSAQLIQRSNQFNLTGRRRSASELLSLMGEPSWMTRTVSLTDRFGDNGLVSVVLAAVRDDILEIDTWLMSCRVLKRGVEQFLLAHLVGLALGRGLKGIEGVYIPTAKNALVRDHYANLGFSQLAAEPGGQTSWILPVTPQWQSTTTFIKESGRSIA